MKEYRDASGVRKIWYDSAEIDQIMEDELVRAGWPTEGASIALDIDRFISKHLGVEPDFINLPIGVQGTTRFYADGRFEIEICAELAKDAGTQSGALHRLRSTLAHEAAHAILHRILYLEETTNLFGGDPGTRELCRDIEFTSSAKADWREWQANRGMAGLLMPRGRFIHEVQSIEKVSPGCLLPGRNEETEKHLALIFLVSAEAVKYRLQDLGLSSPANQSKLAV